MFTLCNQIAYNNLMVNGVHRDLGNPEKPDSFDSPTKPIIAASYWADEQASSPGSHLQPNQIDRLESALAYLKRQGIPPSEVIAISPFRAVADRLESLIPRYPGLRAGTIHTAQGREAPVVILVLGGDPNKPGAPANWSNTPNLVNVAASRAKRRLYVIGDRSFWARHNYFRDLSNALHR
jgi:superfamily I DNA and/or RNA helicase